MTALHNQLAAIQQQIDLLTESLLQLKQEVASRTVGNSRQEDPEKEIGIIRYRKLHGKDRQYSREFIS
ncbi:hypothetical protein GCM10023187_44010 [Nibrella viscosa]|uniref:Uncharacterized protein n=1 Tax=Nibrella viscosa TaxID=1084524 RepID=A0ABP8KRM3_9BACT